jgi:hypothetical protein
LADFSAPVFEPDLQMKNFIIKLLCGQKKIMENSSLYMISNCACCLDIRREEE